MLQIALDVLCVMEACAMHIQKQYLRVLGPQPLACRCWASVPCQLLVMAVLLSSGVVKSVICIGEYLNFTMCEACAWRVFCV